MILDTTFLVDVLRGDSEVADRLESVDETGTPFVSAVTMMELAEGIHLSDASETEKTAVSDLLRDVNGIPFDRSCAMRAGKLNADLIQAGQPVDETDVMIAATALVHDYPVVTRNISYFGHIEELEVLSY